MENKPFKILSIDGGGIRGVFPAKFLVNVEAELKNRGNSKWQIHENFDLICGASTGGIIAIALALGIPAQEIYDLYMNNATAIFGEKRSFISCIVKSMHKNDNLKNLLRRIFKKEEDGTDLRIANCKTSICIPTYNLFDGTVAILKTKHHSMFTRDFHLPAYMAAMATASAPFYFDPYSDSYEDLHGKDEAFRNRVDGGVFANNPTLIGIIEAQEAFGKELKDLRVLSLGTGHQKFSESNNRKRWGIYYWVKYRRKRILDVFMQAQSQHVESLVSLLQNGIGKQRANDPSFIYDRIDVELDNELQCKLDETDKEKLKKIADKAHHKFHGKSHHIITTYCS